MLKSLETVQLNIPFELYQRLRREAEKEKKSITGLLGGYVSFYQDKNTWQKMEAEADEDLRTGRFKEFNSIDELIKDLNS